MKLSKKLLATALLLAVCFAAVSAAERIDPESLTSKSTQKLFGTDVDDYLSVNEWSNVQPTKVFGFLSYGGIKDSARILNTGFAVPVGKFYLSAFFGGQLNSWESTTGSIIGSKDKNGPFSSSKTTTTNKASGSILFGFNNIGIMGNITYQPGTGNSTDKNDTTYKKESITNKYTLEAAVKAGFNVAGPKDILFKTSAEIGITSKANKTKVDDKNNSAVGLTINNNNVHTLHINGGVYFDFKHNGPVTQSASFDLSTDWDIFPTTTNQEKNDGTGNKLITTKKYGRLHDVITLEPAWQITYEPEASKVALKAKVGMPIEFDFNNEYNYEEKTGQAKAYNTARKHTTTINFKPSVTAGLTYAPISQIRFNAGVGFNVPKFGWTIIKTQHRKADDGSINADTGGTERRLKYAVTTADGKMNLVSGLTWFVTQNVTFDASWKLTDNLLDKALGHKLKNGDDIWKTINKVLVHEARFMLSVKL